MVPLSKKNFPGRNTLAYFSATTLPQKKKKVLQNCPLGWLHSPRKNFPGRNILAYLAAATLTQKKKSFTALSIRIYPLSKKKLSRKKHSSLLRIGNIDAEEKKSFTTLSIRMDPLSKNKLSRKKHSSLPRSSIIDAEEKKVLRNCPSDGLFIFLCTVQP
jgi:hypothetical protein